MILIYTSTQSNVSCCHLFYLLFCYIRLFIQINLFYTAIILTNSLPTPMENLNISNTSNLPYSVLELILNDFKLFIN